MLITVHKDKFAPGMREDDRLLGVSLSGALTRVWQTDAHFAAYAPIELPVTGTDRTAIVRPRITADADCPSTIYDTGVPMRMVVLVGDLDDPVAHETGGDARPEWCDDVAQRLDAAGLTWYRTRGGARAIMRLATPFEIQTPADTAAWRELYMAWRQWALEVHGLEIDRACADPTRVFRLPRVVRDGEPNEADVVGLDAIPVFDPSEHLRAPPDAVEVDGRVVSGEREHLPAEDETPAPTERARRLAKAIGLRWLDGGRIETHAALHLFGGLLGHHWSKAEVASLLALLDAHEPDAAKRAEHRHILGNAAPIDGFGGFVEWAGDDWHDADAAINYDPWAERRKAEAQRERQAQAQANIEHNANPYLAIADVVDRAKPPPTLTYVVPGLELAPGKVSVIQAYARGGKTPIALLLALCVASGRDFVGFDVIQCPTAYVAFEGGILTEEREARLCAGLGIVRADVPMQFSRPHGFLDGAFVEAFETNVRMLGIGLVVIDTYTSGLPGDIDHNSSRFSEALRRLGEMSDATGCCVVVLMHENKSDKVDGMRGISGHNTAAGAVQTAIRLRNDPERSTVTVSCTREVRRPFETFDVRFVDRDDPNAPTGSALVAERVATVTPEQVAAMAADGARPCNAARQHEKRRHILQAGERIMAHVQSQSAVNRHHSRSTLDQSAGGEPSRGAIREARVRLVEAGLLRADPSGGYELTEAGAVAGPEAVTAALVGPPAALGQRFARA